MGLIGTNFEKIQMPVFKYITNYELKQAKASCEHYLGR
jgi:hypothetical protein